MQRLVIVVDQLEEVKRLIQLGELSHLRMALLLLDNTSEVLMQRVIRARMQRQEFRDRLYQRASEELPPEELERWKKEFEYTPMSSNQRKSLERNYNEKVDFLITESKLAEPVGKVLKAIHRYRNEAYHRDKVRKETIRPVVAVLFDIVTGLLVVLSSGSMRIDSTDDWTVFCGRYRLKNAIGILDVGLAKIRDSLKYDMSLEVQEIATDLSEHLNSRLDELDEVLQFIVENSQGDFTLQQEIKRIQLWHANNYFSRDPSDPLFVEFTAPHSTKDIESWRKKIDALNKKSDRDNLFAAFAELELEVEPLEEQVHSVAEDIDIAIQMEIDIARGK